MTTAETIRDWWLIRLRPQHHPTIGDDTSAARALRARLRRADSPVEVLSEAAVHDLARRLPWLRNRPDELAQLAQVIAGVEKDSPQRLATILGQSPEPGGDRPRMAELRFQRLIRASRTELGVALRRALALAGDACNVGALGRDLLDWSHPERGERVRIGWCFDYFGAARPGRADPDTTEELAE